ncbi:hypothetical protein Tco_1449312 [Tanacetum coccineum]
MRALVNHNLLPESTATHLKDLKGNIQPRDRDLTSRTFNKGTAKTTPRPEGLLRDKDSGGNIPPADMEPINPTDADLSWTNVRAFLLSDDEAQESEKDIFGAGEEMDEEPQAASIAETHHQKVSNALFARIIEDNWEKHEKAAVNYANLKASINDYYDENIAHRDQTDKLVEASMSSLDKSSNTISDLYKGLNIITELLKEIKNAVKDDSAHSLKQDKELAAWVKSSTNMAWNLGSRLLGLEWAQNHIQSNMSFLKEDTHSIKTIMTEMYEVFKGQSSSSAIPTLSLTYIPANVEGENATNTATKEPPSHTEGETGEPKKAIPISIIQPIESNHEKGIPTESYEDPSKRLVPTSTIVHPNPDEEAKVPLMINGKMYYLTNKEMQAYLDKEDKLRKDGEEEKLLIISKPKVIKVVQEEAKKIGLDPKKIVSAKASEKFKKAQDAKHQVLKREHIKKVRKSLELRKHKFENYMWTINSILKLETITDIKIHPKTKPVVITVYRGIDGRNFDVHKPFTFGAFGISKLDELREIIPKKKNAVSTLPAPEQASSKSLKKKRKHMELDPEIKIPGLECNRALTENVPFVNNIVIEEPEFSMKLKKLIAEHPDQEKLKSNKSSWKPLDMR